MTKTYFKTVALMVICLMMAVTTKAGKYQNFKVSTYIRAQDVAKMDDEKFLKSTWETVSSQVDLDKIYIETHRDAFTVPEKTLNKVKKFFLSKGLEVGGGITYTRSEPTDFETYSYAREDERKIVKEVAEYTAKFFDDIILDDFFFLDLKNDDEIAAKGNRSWTEYRLRTMADAGRELVVNPAKAVNPKVKVIVKYPNWTTFMDWASTLRKNRHISTASGQERRHATQLRHNICKTISAITSCVISTMWRQGAISADGWMREVST